ncbi:hypothetical protein DPMN_057699 [Dreissena polymorpha]|uniref:Uncharacterized protein n=1 Tax=Dreissena polymorpha TaxID=45954 RepID=A0A9D4HF76_DREPO|nr:hypothetical protein DPMN_057699 [Dreissena polymorpha]
MMTRVVEQSCIHATGIGSVRPSYTFALGPFALDSLCGERNWPEITDTDADEDERALTNTDQQSMGNLTSTDVSSVAADLEPLDNSTSIDVSSVAADLDPLEGTFNITQRNFDVTMEPIGTALAKPELPDTVTEDVPITFTMLENGSKRGGRLLVSSNGYSYGVMLR